MLGLEVFVCSGDWKNERRVEVRMSEESVQGWEESKRYWGEGEVSGGRKGKSELK